MDNNTRQELDNVTFVASTFAPGPMQFLLVVSRLFAIFLGWLSLSAEIFVRFRLGERYLTILRVLLAWLAFQVFRQLYYLIGAFLVLIDGAMNINIVDIVFGGGGMKPGLGRFIFPEITVAYHVFEYAFWFLSALQMILIWKRNSDEVIWHSQSFGLSWLEFLPWGVWNWLVKKLPSRLAQSALVIDDWKLYCLIEPLVCFVVAMALGTYDEVLGLWLRVASVALLFKNWMTYSDMRSRLLDMTDAEIENRYMTESLNGVDKRDTAGFSVVPARHIAAFRSGKLNIAETVSNVMRKDASPSASVSGVDQSIATD